MSTVSFPAKKGVTNTGGCVLRATYVRSSEKKRERVFTGNREGVESRAQRRKGVKRRRGGGAPEVDDRVSGGDVPLSRGVSTSRRRCRFRKERKQSFS